MNEWRALLKVDEEQSRGQASLRIVYKLWPDFKVKPLMDRSVATVKADAAFRSYSATGAGITWAVIDSGIDGAHPHFGTKNDAYHSAMYHPDVQELHFDFTIDDDEADNSLREDRAVPKTDDDIAKAKAARARACDAALQDGLGHGTHVAGIIAGELPKDTVADMKGGEDGKPRYTVFEQVFEAAPKANASGTSSRSLGSSGTLRH